MVLDISVKEIMTKPIVKIDYGKTVQQAAKEMVKHRVGSIVIIKKNNPIGIITETDITKRIVAPAKDPKKLKVEDVMSSPLVFASPDDDVSEVIEKMEKHKIRRLPILQKRKIVGIVTHTDIARSCPMALDLLTTRLKMRETNPSIEETSTSGICEACDNYSEDLEFTDDQWVCEACRE